MARQDRSEIEPVETCERREASCDAGNSSHAPARPLALPVHTRSPTMMFCSRYGSALLLALGMLSAHVADAYYYGGYRYYGGPAVVRRTTVVRGRRGRWGRRLAQVDDEDFDALAFLAESPATSPSMAPAASVAEEEDDATECDTILDIVETRPEFSSLAAALADLPMLREAMATPNRTDTFFAPTNDAIESLLEWGGFVDRAEVRPPRTGVLKTLLDLVTVVSSDGSRAVFNLFAGTSVPIALDSLTSSPSSSQRRRDAQGIQEMLGNVSFKALIVAYHAVPGAVYSAEDLKTIGADGPPENYLDTALARILAAVAELEDPDAADSLDPVATSSASEPLYIDEFGGDVYVKGIGSEAKVVAADIEACNGVVHAVSHVLLPVDGDGELSEEQKARIAEIRERSDRLVAENLADLDDDDDDGGAAPEAAPDDDEDEAADDDEADNED